MTTEDVLKRLPAAQRGAIAFIKAQIAHLEAQIENLRGAMRTLGLVEIDDTAEAEPEPPKGTPQPIPANRKQEGRRAGYEIDTGVLLAQVGCLLVDGPMRIGVLEERTGVSRNTLTYQMKKSQWFALIGFKSEAKWHLSDAGRIASATGFRKELRCHVPDAAPDVAASPSTSAAG